MAANILCAPLSPPTRPPRHRRAPIPLSARRYCPPPLVLCVVVASNPALCTSSPQLRAAAPSARYRAPRRRRAPLSCRDLRQDALSQNARAPILCVVAGPKGKQSSCGPSEPVRPSGRRTLVVPIVHLAHGTIIVQFSIYEKYLNYTIYLYDKSTFIFFL